MNHIEIIDILKSKKRKEKIEVLSYLQDVFESYNEKIDGFDIIINTLIELGCSEKDVKIKELFFDILAFASDLRDLSNFDFKEIKNEILYSQNDKIIASCLIILGNTHIKDYLTVIEKFKTHKNKHVAKEAFDAIKEIVES